MMLTKLMIGDFAKDPLVTFNGRGAYDPSKHFYGASNAVLEEPYVTMQRRQAQAGTVVSQVHFRREWLSCVTE